MDFEAGASGRGTKRGWSNGGQRRGWNPGWRGRGTYNAWRGGTGWKRGNSRSENDEGGSYTNNKFGRSGTSGWSRRPFRGMPLPRPSQAFREEDEEAINQPAVEGPSAKIAKFNSAHSNSGANFNKVGRFPEHDTAGDNDNDDDADSRLPQIATLMRTWVDVPICRADRRGTPYHGAALYFADSVGDDFNLQSGAEHAHGPLIARLLRAFDAFLEAERALTARQINRTATRSVYRLDYAALTRNDSVVFAHFDREEFLTLFEMQTDLVLAACGLLLYDRVARSWIERYKLKQTAINAARQVTQAIDLAAANDAQANDGEDQPAGADTSKAGSAREVERSGANERESERTLFSIRSPRFVAVRPVNYSQNRLSIGAVRSAAFGRLVTVSALVARVAPRDNIAFRVAYRCAICGVHKIVQCATLNGSVAPSFSGTAARLSFPERCGAQFGVASRSVACRSSSFEMVDDTTLTEFVPTQLVTLQELISDSGSSSNLEDADAFQDDEPQRSVASGRGVPKSIDALLSRELVDACEPGQHVTVVGIVRTKDGPGVGSGATSYNQAASRFRGANARLRRHFYLHVLALAIASTNEEHDDPFASALAVSNSNSNLQVQTSHSQLPPTFSSQLQSQASCTAQPNQKSTHAESFSPAERALIESFRDDPQSARTVFPRLVASLCPHIYGHEMVKAGLVLALFGGAGALVDHSLQSNPAANESEASCANTSWQERFATRFRENCHVLMVGDPGIGKSQLLSAVACCAPRSTTVSGESATACGLTCALVKARSGPSGAAGTSFRDSFVLEAGALVLADRGVCCIDEFTHLRSEMSALLEALEQQTVSVAKAGILCTLPARTTLVAASNPTGGRYDPGRCLAENVQLPPALLSRFDLIFTMIDIPDAERDRLLTEHIFDFRAAATTRTINPDPRRARTDNNQNVNVPNWRAAYSSTQVTDDLDAPAQGNEPAQDDPDDESDPNLFRKVNRQVGAMFAASDSSLADRLKRIVPALVRTDRNGCAQLLSPAFIRRYVAYARLHCRPSLDPEAAAFLQRCYVELRTRSADEQQVSSVTPRHLQSLVRLTQARARCELRSCATVSDAREVVEIMSETLLKLFYEGAASSASLNYSLLAGCCSTSQRSGSQHASAGSCVLDKTRSAGGVSQSNRKASKQKEFVSLLYTVVEKRTADPDCPVATRCLFSTSDLRELGKLLNMNMFEFDQLTTRLNQDGALLKVAAGTYKLTHTGD